MCVWKQACLALAVVALCGFKSFQPEFSELRLQAALRPVGSMRVQIFPHLNNYAPQGRDAQPRRATIESSADCRVLTYDGRKQLAVARSIPLEAARLTEALWIECDRPAKLIREGAKASYSYAGAFHVRALKRKGETLLQVINHLPLDQYLKGVVPIEMPAHWPLEALKAQAVAARTYAAFNASIAREDFLDGLYDVDDTVLYQAYTGVSDSDPRSDRAVDETSGLAVTWEKSLIQAFFSADSGGHTESAENAWQVGKVPYCVARPEVYTAQEIDQNRWGPWQVKLDLVKLQKTLLAQNVGDPAHPVSGVRVLDSDRTESGRARIVTLDLQGRGPLRVNGNQFRSWLGLKSTLIWTDEAAPGTLSGRGFGHGVGMSQLGAMTLASRRGWTFRQILDFYYFGIEIVTLISQ